jgi:hypothetical protein
MLHAVQHPSCETHLSACLFHVLQVCTILLLLLLLLLLLCGANMLLPAIRYILSTMLLLLLHRECAASLCCCIAIGCLPACCVIFVSLQVRFLILHIFFLLRQQLLGLQVQQRTEAAGPAPAALQTTL